MPKALLRRIVTIIVRLACALALTLAAYRHIAKPAQREDDVPDAVVEVLERAAGEESDVASPATQDDAQAAAEGQQDDASSGQDAVAAVSQYAGDEMPTDEEPHVFTMPEGAAYVEGVALLQVGEDATAQDFSGLFHLVQDTAHGGEAQSGFPGNLGLRKRTAALKGPADQAFIDIFNDRFVITNLSHDMPLFVLKTSLIWPL